MPGQTPDFQATTTKAFLGNMGVPTSRLRLCLFLYVSMPASSGALLKELKAVHLC